MQDNKQTICFVNVSETALAANHTLHIRYMPRLLMCVCVRAFYSILFFVIITTTHTTVRQITPVAIFIIVAKRYSS